MARNEAFRNLVIERLKEDGVPAEEWEKVDEQGRTFLRLPKSQVEILKIYRSDKVMASVYALEMDGNYWVQFQEYRLSDLPKDLIAAGNLKRFGIDTGNPQPCGGD